MTKKGHQICGQEKCTPRENPGYAYVDQWTERDCVYWSCQHPLLRVGVTCCFVHKEERQIWTEVTLTVQCCVVVRDSAERGSGQSPLGLSPEFPRLPVLERKRFANDINIWLGLGIGLASFFCISGSQREMPDKRLWEEQMSFIRWKIDRDTFRITSISCSSCAAFASCID